MCLSLNQEDGFHCSIIPEMLKGFEFATLACGCRLGFRDGCDGSPVTVVVERKSLKCKMSLHVGGMPIYDYREALRPSNRLVLPLEGDYEEEG